MALDFLRTAVKVAGVGVAAAGKQLKYIVVLFCTVRRGLDRRRVSKLSIMLKAVGHWPSFPAPSIVLQTTFETHICFI